MSYIGSTYLIRAAGFGSRERLSKFGIDSILLLFGEGTSPSEAVTKVGWSGARDQRHCDVKYVISAQGFCVPSRSLTKEVHCCLGEEFYPSMKLLSKVLPFIKL